jgi:general secretion pathway protein I
MIPVAGGILRASVAKGSQALRRLRSGRLEGWAAAKPTGFTLIEVLVALAILAITFGFGFRALSGGFDRLNRDQRSANALLLAQSTLARVGYDIALEDGAVDGRTPDGFAWRIETVPYGDTQDLLPGRLIGHRVNVTIAWSERHQRREVRLTSLLLGPKGQGP